MDNFTEDQQAESSQQDLNQEEQQEFSDLAPKTKEGADIVFDEPEREDSDGELFDGFSAKENKAEGEGELFDAVAQAEEEGKADIFEGIEKTDETIENSEIAEVAQEPAAGMVDEIQNALSEAIADITDDEEESIAEADNELLEFEEVTADVSNQEINFEQTIPMLMQNLPTDTTLSAEAKKYVIYVDSENIDFIENLTIDERRIIINKILKEQNAVAVKQKIMQARKKFIKHILVATATIIIGFPILFFVVNKAMEASIINYKQAQQNFIDLYKSKNKYPQAGSSSLKQIKF